MTARPTVVPQPAPRLRLKLRTKLVVAMLLAALVPVAIVAVIATRAVLSSLERGLDEDADRQLTVGLNLILRAVERLGEQCVQLSESRDLAAAMSGGTPALEQWLSVELAHAPSARLQLLDPNGALVFDRMVVGSLTCDPAQPDATHPECYAARRFADIGVRPGEGAGGQPWSRDVTLVAIGDGVVVRAVSPIVDSTLQLRGTVVLSLPLDGDFADGIKGALSADVLIGGTSGDLAATFRSPLGRRGDPVKLSAADRDAALRRERVIRDVDLPTGHYAIASTGLLDHDAQPVGIVAVAVDRTPLAATRALAIRSLVIGGLGAVAFALVLALFWSRRLGAPIHELHRGAIAVSRGDLEHRIVIPGGDELTDLAAAFNQMTSTLKDNQARLAARMREIVALHDAGRAVSSVIDLDQVSRKIVDAVARTFDVQLATLWLVDPRGLEAPPTGKAGGVPPGDQLRASAARSRRADVTSSLATDEALAAAEPLREIAMRVQAERRAVRRDQPAPLVALPLERPRVTRPRAPGSDPEREDRVVGVLAVSRAEDAREFSDADLNLLTTFADQAGAAVENAQLYQEVRGASEELEKKVKLRTSELTAINTELGKALADLRETQAQLVLSERMAGLGLLVAGVAHEINSPSAAIRGSIDGLAAALARVARHGAEIASFVAYLETTAPALAERPLPSGLAMRKAARELAGELEAAGIADAGELAASLADLGATPADAARLVATLGAATSAAAPLVAALTDHVYLHRTASTVRHAVGQIQRIVGALKTYSHLDQQPTRVEADLHEGLETTLTLLHHALRDIVVERRYGTLPRVPIFVDELNQVWTNLISNAQQALAGKGTIAIETVVDGGHAIVRVIDDGPGVPTDVLPRIFEPFFTTKPKGEGTGLGLGIARQIVAKHGGELRCESVPGRTCFEVRLPVGVG